MSNAVLSRRACLDAARSDPSIPKMYRPPPTTKEYEERNYYVCSSDQPSASLVSLSPFWADFAAFMHRHLFVDKQQNLVRWRIICALLI